MSSARRMGVVASHQAGQRRSSTAVPVPKPAASVLVVRQAKAQPHIEVFCVKRHMKSKFMGGAIVFPGGKVDTPDADAVWLRNATPVTERCSQPSVDVGRSYCVAALRETFEEAALLPVVGRGVSHGEVLKMREDLVARQKGIPRSEHGKMFAELFNKDFQLDVGRLTLFSRWVTPTAEPRRFDTWFYLMEQPAGQHGRHDQHETTESFWARPTEVLRRAEAGEIFLAPPQVFTMKLFEAAKSVAEAQAIAASQMLNPIQPIMKAEDGKAIVVFPGDPDHPDPGLSTWPTSMPHRLKFSF